MFDDVIRSVFRVTYVLDDALENVLVVRIRRVGPAPQHGDILSALAPTARKTLAQRTRSTLPDTEFVVAPLRNRQFRMGAGRPQPRPSWNVTERPTRAVVGRC